MKYGASPPSSMSPAFVTAAPIRLRATLLALGMLAAGVGVIISDLRAHGDDQVLVAALSEELARAPDADLFIRRGELFRHLREWAKAEADFDAAAKFAPELALVDYFRARLSLESGAPEKAKTFVDRYVAKAPQEAEGRFLRGDILAVLGDFAAGALEYAEGIRRAPRPQPQHYLQQARFLAAAPEADIAQALASLDAGIARLGPLVVLVEAAIALELERKNYDAALSHIATAMEHTPRREIWLVRRGDVLATSGRLREAAEAYRAALSAIERLPERYRETVPMEKLARDARSALDRAADSTQALPSEGRLER